MNNHLVSIIVPIFKVEPYLRNCLESIINQTYRNIEIILVDDGSPDGCGKICDEYSDKDDRIIVIHQNNKGLSSARNKGLDVASGEYILFVDSDDWIELNTCEVVLTIALNLHVDIVCFGNVESFQTGKSIIRTIDNSMIIEKKDILKQLLWGGDIHNAVWNKLFRRSLFKEVRFPEGRIWEDGAVMYKLIHFANEIYVTNHVLYHYIHRNNSISCGRYSMKSVKDIIWAWKERLLFFQRNYPDFVEKQKACILREMIIGKELFKEEFDYSVFVNDYEQFLKENKNQINKLAVYTRIVWLYYYCRPLSSLYIKWRYGCRKVDLFCGII